MKRYASCGAEIAVFVLGKNEPIGLVKKSGAELFVPPSVTQESHQLPDVSDCIRFIMNHDELKSIKLEGFDGVIAAYKKLMEDKDKVEEQPEVKDAKLTIEKRH